MNAILGAWSLGIGGGLEGEGVRRDSAGRFEGVIGSGNGVASPEDIVGAGPSASRSGHKNRKKTETEPNCNR